VRIIEGQHTKLTRVAHGLTYDPGNDEIIATEPLAASIVFFHGGASGDHPPDRVIQGPHTLLHAPWQPAADDVHNELWIADLESDALLVFPLNGNGDVAPLRVIHYGPKSGMRLPSGVAVDPQRNLVAVAARDRHYNAALFVFRRTDSGDATPLSVIEGPATGIVGLFHVALYGGQLFAGVDNFYYVPPYDAGGYEPRDGCQGPTLPWMGPLGFVGVWNVTDNGNVPPHAIIRGAETGMVHPSAVAVDPIHGEVFATDGVRNGTFGFLVPEFFPSTAPR